MGQFSIKDLLLGVAFVAVVFAYCGHVRHAWPAAPAAIGIICGVAVGYLFRWKSPSPQLSIKRLVLMEACILAACILLAPYLAARIFGAWGWVGVITWFAIGYPLLAAGFGGGLGAVYGKFGIGLLTGAAFVCLVAVLTSIVVNR